MGTESARLVQAIADHLTGYGYLTHAERDALGRAFAAGWAAQGADPDTVTVSRAYLAALEVAAGRREADQ